MFKKDQSFDASEWRIEGDYARNVESGEFVLFSRFEEVYAAGIRFCNEKASIPRCDVHSMKERVSP